MTWSEWFKELLPFLRCGFFGGKTKKGHRETYLLYICIFVCRGVFCTKASRDGSDKRQAAPRALRDQDPGAPPDGTVVVVVGGGSSLLPWRRLRRPRTSALALLLLLLLLVLLLLLSRRDVREHAQHRVAYLVGLQFEPQVISRASGESRRLLLPGLQIRKKRNKKEKQKRKKNKNKKLRY